MQKIKLKRLLDLHAWFGVTTGLFIFIIAFSGVVALFGDELRTWEDHAYRLKLPDNPVPVNPLIDSLIQDKVKEGSIINNLFVNFPSEESPYYRINLIVKPSEGKNQHHTVLWNSATGEKIEDRGNGLSYWLVEFHRKLMLPTTIGRTLVGLAGIFMLLAIITGVLTHKKIVKDLFSWRMNKTLRVRWKDSHNALGIWGLPFHTMIAFTGAFLGIVALLIPLIGVTAFKGDQQAVIDLVLGEKTQASGQYAPMQSLNKIRQDIYNKTGRYTNIVSITNWEDETAEFRFSLPPKKELVRFTRLTVHGATGKIEKEQITEFPNTAGRVYAALTPLHYATYGGIWLKILYMVLGIGLCLMIVSGLVLWVERRRYSHTGHRSDTFYDYLGRMITGVVSGMVLSSILLFYVDRLISVQAEQRIQLVGYSYFGIWILAIIYSLSQNNGYRTNKYLLGLSAIALIALPFLDMITTFLENGYFFESDFLYVQGANLLAFVTGLAMIFVLTTLPNKRPKREQKTL